MWRYNTANFLVLGTVLPFLYILMRGPTWLLEETPTEPLFCDWYIDHGRKLIFLCTHLCPLSRFNFHWIQRRTFVDSAPNHFFKGYESFLGSITDFSFPSPILNVCISLASILELPLHGHLFLVNSCWCLLYSSNFQLIYTIIPLFWVLSADTMK